MTQNQTELAYEIVSFSYKEGVPFEQQREATETLSELVSQFEGFISRSYYYSDDNKRWFDFITWRSVDDAKSATEHMMAHPTAQSAFELMDDESMMFAHYKKLGGIGNR